MISLYNYSNYRHFILAFFGQQAKSGRGQALKLSRFLGVHATLVSQVLHGTKTLTVEQASLAAEFLGLLDREAEYFLLLVQLDRAGNAALKKILTRRLAELKKLSSDLGTRLSAERKLSEEQKSIFYSDWIFSAVRQLVAIPGFDNPEKISEKLGISLKKVREIIHFLLENGLCLQSESGLRVGPQSTHLDAISPWVRVHHTNWRQRALENYSKDDFIKLHFSAPMTISHKDALEFRERIIKFLEGLDPAIEQSASETLVCLNIDWFTI